MKSLAKQILLIATEIGNLNLDPNLRKVKSKRTAINYIYKKVNSFITGFFRDQSWENVQKVFTEIRKLGVDFSYDTDRTKGGDYHTVKHSETFSSKYKQWNIEITFKNDLGVEFQITGRLIATDASDSKTQYDFDRYDICLILE